MRVPRERSDSRTEKRRTLLEESISTADQVLDTELQQDFDELACQHGTAVIDPFAVAELEAAFGDAWQSLVERAGFRRPCRLSRHLDRGRSIDTPEIAARARRLTRGP